MRVLSIAMILCATACAGAPQPRPAPPPTLAPEKTPERVAAPDPLKTDTQDRAAAPSEVVDDALDQGAERMKTRDYAGALASFQRCAQLAPADERCAWNAGLAAYLDGKFSVAIEHWKKGRLLEPGNWRLRAKLIQAYHGLGDLRARDEERAALLKERARAGADDELGAAASFCRDQWTFGPYRVMAFEYFDQEGPGARLIYRFVVGKDGGEEGGEWLALASMPGKSGPSYDLLSFAGEDSRPVLLAQYSSWKAAPPYDELRKIVGAALQGAQKPLRGEPLKLP